MNALAQKARELAQSRITDLLTDSQRFERCQLQVGQLHIDHSKQGVDLEALNLLNQLASERAVPQAIKNLFAGDKINHTEDRAVQHMALRALPNSRVLIDGQNVIPAVQAVRQRIALLSEQVRSGAWLGATGERIKRVINIGIGGSDLGPRMVTIALNAVHEMSLETRFVANVDPTDLALALRGATPASTLFIIASKTFTTTETLLNATAARTWLQASLGADVSQHLIAVSAFPERASAFGIKPDNVLPMWDWVGGRYSLWSAVGLPIAMAFGAATFEALLSGAQQMDSHFATAPIERNAPIQHALIGVWNSQYKAYPTHVVIPYSEALSRFPAFLQQLEMESNGKRVSRDGEPVNHTTCPALWGEVGTNGQHAFFQWLHQGTQVAPVDFILPKSTPNAQSQALAANALAQARALMIGQAHDNPHRAFPGNRPSTMIVLNSLNAESLGQLIALYEHKVFVQGVIWGINSFDQFGVELGKEIANQILPSLQQPEKESDFDASTLHLLKILQQ
jgi:glucose-6-phosphate isomerase